MSLYLVAAIITITLALVFYTIGVFGERRSKTLEKKHVLLFWLGLVFDTTGTTIMSFIAKSAETTNATLQTFHSITGVLAIVLMLIHAVWASWVLWKNDAKQKAFFHKFSLFVWIIWLFPYIAGMIVGMLG
ncbi:MAG: HsmA family protein [Bacilli bacterium]